MVESLYPSVGKMENIPFAKKKDKIIKICKYENYEMRKNEKNTGKEKFY